MQVCEGCFDCRGGFAGWEVLAELLREARGGEGGVCVEEGDAGGFAAVVGGQKGEGDELGEEGGCAAAWVLGGEFEDGLGQVLVWSGRVG